MKRGALPYFLLSLAVFIVDQSTKYFIRTGLEPYGIIHVLPVLNVVHIENAGSAFGLFKGLGNTFFVILAACASLFIAFLVLTVKERGMRTAFSLTLGGAAGNLADRIMHGHVTDFLDVHAGNYHWPAFNVADSALTAGVALILLQLVFDMRRSRRHV